MTAVASALMTGVTVIKTEPFLSGKNKNAIIKLDDPPFSSWVTENSSELTSIWQKAAKRLRESENSNYELGQQKKQSWSSKKSICYLEWSFYVYMGRKRISCFSRPPTTQNRPGILLVQGLIPQPGKSRPGWQNHGAAGQYQSGSDIQN